LLIIRSAEAGLNSITVSTDYIVSVVEGLKPPGVSDMKTAGVSETIDDHGERWD
jgi:hypothetical protein